jgi:hypothetical protein
MTEMMQSMMSELMQGMGAAGSEEGGGDMVNSMIEGLLSKEVLYPSLVEINKKV